MSHGAGTHAASFLPWLEAAAEDLDTGHADKALLLPALAASGLAGAGVPQALGGGGGSVVDGVRAIAEVSSRSLAAGFVLWGHRTYIEYLLQSPNAGLSERLIAPLLAGEVAGATGLSNAMKFLAGLEGLQVMARKSGAGFSLDGKLPWVTNLRPEGFHVAAAVASAEGGAPFVASLASNAAGLERSADLDLIALRGTNTAAVTLANVAISEADILHSDARPWLPRVRPAFLGLQIGMSIGLARRALKEAGDHIADAGRHVLSAPIAELSAAIDAQENALFEGLASGSFAEKAAPLFKIRIALAELANASVGLELQASGGRAYLSGAGRDFARRWREAAFLPIITPSLVQLKAALADHAAPGSGQAA
ncbi:acyl-CoA dehydrogenase family protein [Roseixanthobacter glucoisosaccharinicivorans]|uniref:acyl-CoA dehydrogenase family protein n=1 Tax=Roseixanthobacter glucoisosaccharinicivorans TaxID=3119923 RepID=UPI0037296733